MKRTSLLIAAVIPFVAVAAPGTGSQKIDHEELRGDLQITNIIGSEVKAGDGRDVGTVEDVILGRDGSIMSVIVQRDGEVLMNDTEQSAERGMEQAGYEEHQENFDDDAADFGEVGGTDLAGTVEDESMQDGAERADVSMDSENAGGMETGDGFARVEWSSVSYDNEEDVLRLNGDAASLESVQYEQSSAQDMQDEVRASELVGMEVDLSDEESFGEVEDVLINAESGKASALVVDSMEFFDKERYALPVELNDINAEEETLTLQYSAQQLEEMGEFDMEMYTDET